MGRKLILVLLVLLSLTACGGSRNPDFSSVNQGLSNDTAGAAAPAAPAAEPEFAEASAESAVYAYDSSESAAIDGRQVQGAQSGQAAAERLVIRTAIVRALVQDVNVAETRVRELAEGRGGFVLSSEASGEDDQRTATVSFKVPAERFDETLSEVGKLALKVDSLRVEGQDVTDEYVDIESRLRNLRAVETRLLQFLNDANRTEDALAVNAQLTDIQGQIEQAQGRIAYLKQSAALSTITVEFYAQPVISLLSEPSWVPSATARGALNDLISFGQALADVVIVAAVWAPIWLPLLLLTLWLRRRLRRPPPAATPDPSAAQP